MRKMFVIFIFVVILSGACLFDENPVKLEEIDLKDKGYGKIFLYKSFSNATVSESIQIRTQNDSINAKIIFERYDTILGRKIIEDQLVLTLKDSKGIRSEIDTFVISLDSIFY